jgi:predicted Zn-ribbon and HTH transcriptional regulator
MKLASRCPQVVLSAIALNFRRLSTARQQVLFDLLAHTRSTKKAASTSILRPNTCKVTSNYCGQ